MPCIRLSRWRRRLPFGPRTRPAVFISAGYTPGKATRRLIEQDLRSRPSGAPGWLFRTRQSRIGRRQRPGRLSTACFQDTGVEQLLANRLFTAVLFWIYTQCKIKIMPLFIQNFRKRAGVAFTIFMVLSLGISTLPASTATSEAALQNCPSVEDEIIDLEMLAGALRGSNAVGILEKLRLKRRIDDLLGQFMDYHNGHRDYSLQQLEEQYNVLLMRIASHVQHKDQILHQQLCNAWLLIWMDLEDSGRFMEMFSG
jgi:hypothetical protein